MKLTLHGSAKGHTFTAVQAEDGTCEVTAWLLPGGQPAPKKTKLVGKTFNSATATGRAIYEATHEHYGFPEKIEKRSLVLKPDYTSAGRSAPTKPKPKKRDAITDMASLRGLADEPPTDTSPALKRTLQRTIERTSPDRIATLIRASGALPKIPGEKRGDVRTSIQATKDQQGVTDGYCRFWCIDCGDSFIGRPAEGIEGPEPPVRCPKGHICIDLRPNVH